MKNLFLFLKKFSTILLLIILATSSIYSQDVTWTKIELPTNSKLLAVVADSSGKIISAFDDYSTFYSSNNGITWLNDNNNLKKYLDSLGLEKPITAIILGITQEDEIIEEILSGSYIHTYILKSYNQRQMWKQTYGEGYGFEMYSFFINPNNSYVYFTWWEYYGSSGGTKLSTDNGNTWSDYIVAKHNEEYWSRIPWLYLNDSTFISKNSNSLYTTTDNWKSYSSVIFDSASIEDDFSSRISRLGKDYNDYIFVTTIDHGVFFSKLNLWNWKNLGLKKMNLSSIAIGNNQVYVSSDSLGIFKLDSSYTIWQQINNGLKDLNVKEIFFDKSGYLYARTDSELYRSSKILTAIEKGKYTKTNYFQLSQNYPNPFNPSTTISYQLPKAGMVEIKVFDILGREVSTLINKYQNAGSYTVQFDGSKLTSGVYLYRLKSGDYSKLRKMILLK